MVDLRLNILTLGGNLDLEVILVLGWIVKSKLTLSSHLVLVKNLYWLLFLEALLQLLGRRIYLRVFVFAVRVSRALVVRGLQILNFFYGREFNWSFVP